MPTLYLDADACPVKDEAYRVAARYAVLTVVVANSHMRVPTGPLVELVVRPGFGAADDYIAEVCGPGDVVVTADIPLAGRALVKGARVLDPRGREITDNEIGAALGMRELMEDLRARGEVSGGPPPMAAKDRSRFLAKLDEVLVAVRRAR
ncbi:MAG TPA: YaiI/YqxD family protein [Urbifossiella sp.]|nr:YaiI/YqxD family protein [Urbifossiella sp.]